MLLTWIGCYAVIGLYEKVWQWTETALPPASMIDKSSMASSVEQSTPSAKPEPPDNLPEAEYTETVRIASDHYCLGAPLLETVAVQSWLIESSIAVLTIVTLAGLGVGKIEVVNDAILAHPTISTLIALTLFVPPTTGYETLTGFGFVSC